MGSVMGAQLKAGGNDVTLIDVAREALDAINSRGLIVQDKTGTQQTVPIRATDKPAEVGPVDLILVFVKCYHTEAAVRNAAPLMGPARTTSRNCPSGAPPTNWRAWSSSW